MDLFSRVRPKIFQNKAVRQSKTQSRNFYSLFVSSQCFQHLLEPALPQITMPNIFNKNKKIKKYTAMLLSRSINKLAFTVMHRFEFDKQHIQVMEQIFWCINGKSNGFKLHRNTINKSHGLKVWVVVSQRYFEVMEFHKIQTQRSRL